MASSSSGGTSTAFLPRTCAARDAGHFGCTFGSPPGVPGGGITGIDLAPVLGAGFTSPGSVFAVEAGGTITPSGRSGCSLGGGPVGGSPRAAGGATGSPWSAWARAWGARPARPRRGAGPRRNAVPRCRYASALVPDGPRYGFLGASPEGAP